MRKLLIIGFIFVFTLCIADEIQVLKNSLESQTLPGRIKNLNKIAKAYWLVNPESTFVYAEKALKLAEKYYFYDEMAVAYKNKGVGHYFLGDFSEALQFYRKALEIFTSNQNKRGMADIYNNIGLLYQKMNKFDLTLENYLKSFELEQELGDKQGIGESMVNLANFFYFMGKYDKAEEYYNRSLEKFEEVGYKEGVSMVYSNLAAIDDDRKFYNEAIEEYKKSLQIDRELKNYNGIATNLNNIGFSYYKLKKYDVAEENYLQALKYQKDISDSWGISNTYFNLGELYSEWGKFSKAISCYKSSLNLAEQMNTIDLQLKASKGIAEINYKKRNYKTAYDFYKQYASINDSLYKEIGNKKLVDIWSEYQLQKKDKQNELLAQNNKIIKLELQKQRLIHQRLILGIIIIIILGLIFYKLYHIKSRTNQLLQKLVREKTAKLQIEGDERNKAENKLEQRHKQIKSLHASLENKIESALDSLRQKNMQLIKQARQAALGEMAADIISYWEEDIQKLNKMWESKKKDNLSFSSQEITEASKIIKNMHQTTLNFSYVFNAFLKKEEFGLKAVINEVLELLKHSFVENRIQLKVDYKTDCTVYGYRDLFLQVVLNILNNARYFLKARKILNPNIEIELESTKEKCILTISDNAGGIDEEIIGRVFEPYFSTKKQGKHRGLGLFMAKTAIEDIMNGKISVNNIRSGTKFIIEL